MFFRYKFYHHKHKNVSSYVDMLVSILSACLHLLQAIKVTFECLYILIVTLYP